MGGNPMFVNTRLIAVPTVTRSSSQRCIDTVQYSFSTPDRVMVVVTTGTSVLFGLWHLSQTSMESYS